MRSSIALSHARTHRRHLARTGSAHIPVADEALLSSAQLGAPLSSAGAASLSSSTGASRRTASSGAGGSQTLTPAAKAGREFGLEQPGRQVSSSQISSTPEASFARAAATGSSQARQQAQAQPEQHSSHESGGPSAAAREFGLGG